MTPLISFITPVFNTEEYLPECVESVLKQSNSDWELILVDDGSTDESGSICDEYARLDSRIKVIHKKNGGQFRARLDGIAIASGEYCTGLDSDDYIEGECVKTLAETLSRKKYDIVAWNVREIENGTVLNSDKMERYGEYNGLEFVEYVVKSTNHSFCNKLIKTKLLRESKFGNVPLRARHSEDYILICYSLCVADSIIAIDKILYNYRQVKESVTHSFSIKRILDYLDSTECIISIFTDYSSDSSVLIESEYKSLVAAVGYCMKQSFRSGNSSRDEVRRIYTHPVYRELARFETVNNLTLDMYIVMKLFRLRLIWLLNLMYRRRVIKK